MRRIFFLLFCWVLLFIGATTFAQDLEPVDLGDGFSISVPVSWDSEEDSGGILFTGRISRDDFNLFVLTPPQVADQIDVSDDDLTDLLIALIDEVYSVDARSRDIEEIDDLPFPAVAWSYSIDELNGLAYLVEFDTEQYAFMDIWGEDFEDHQEIVNEIIASFRFDADTATDPEAGDEPEPSEPCFVSTDQERTVQIRVGPGQNRSVILFLPAGPSFPVTGRLVDADGNVWLQLDKTEVDPDTAANEMWVAEAAVETSGDCENVVSADAPPVIPGGPRTPPSGSGGGSGGGDAPAVLVPTGGRWSMLLAETGTYSCEGTITLGFNTVELFERGPFTYNLSVAGDQSSITVGGSRFVLLQPGSYNGSFTFNDGSNVQMRLNVQNATFISGQLTFNYRAGGQNCSATVFLTMTRL